MLEMCDQCTIKAIILSVGLYGEHITDQGFFIKIGEMLKHQFKDFL